MKFNLEKAITRWRLKFRKYSEFEDADIVELEDHLRNGIDELVERGLNPEEAFNTIIERDYSQINTISDQFRKVRSSHFNSGLFSNYLKVGWRSLGRNRAYFLINLAGLVIGLSSVFCIVMYLNLEFSYDKFHANYQNIYRVNTLFERASGPLNYPLIPPAVGPAIKVSIPEVEKSTRLRYAYNVLMKSGDKSFYEEKVFFAEPEFFDIFSFEWVLGNSSNAFEEPNTIVLTNRMAKKYFGDTNPIGEIVTYDDEIDLKVIGIIEDVPKESHIMFDFLISFETFKPGPGALEPLTSWRWLGFLTYIQMSPNANVSAIEEKIAGIYRENVNSGTNLSIKIQLQQLASIYLNSGHLRNPQGGLFKVNDLNNLVSLGIIAVLILFIAFFNYFNITAALMRTRAREIGIRKVFGSSKRKIIGQIGTETLVILLIATSLSWMSVFFIANSGLLPVSELEGVSMILLLSIVVVILFTAISGIVFGGTFSAYSAIQLLQGKLSSRTSKFSGGKLVLLLQFSISAAMIMVSLIVVQQLNFMSEKELGYNHKGILVAKFRSEEMHARRNIFAESLKTVRGVKTVSYGPSFDGSSSGNPLRLKEWPEDQVVQTAYFSVDYQFDKTIGLDMVSGRYFSETNSHDSVSSLIINETLAKMLEIDDPVGKKVRFTDEYDYEIIGVFKDFHYQSLHHEIGPMAIKMWLGQPRNVLISFNSENIGETLSSIENAWNDVFKDGAFPFDYRLLDEQLASMYHQEEQFGNLLKVFTGLAIFIALLGLFGLSSININLNLKQIGIRRVLGAEIKQIADVVSTGFLVIVLIGTIISIPMVYFLMNRWLDNYAYAIELGVGFPFVTVLIVLIVTLSTLAIQVYRVMTVNPARILKDE